MTQPTIWLTGGTLLTPDGPARGAVGLRDGRIAAIRKTPGAGERINVRGAYVAPGFMDLHIWGDPEVISREAVKGGTTAFLTAIGPEPQDALLQKLAALPATAEKKGSDPFLAGARCLGAHLEGPFLNPQQCGALPAAHMRLPMQKELTALGRHASRIKLVTLAPEAPGGLEAVRWFARRNIAVSLGHSRADEATTLRAVQNGARLVTHVFNGMRPLHHRSPGLLGAALTEPKLTTMVILDGVHVGARAFRLLLRCKGSGGVILETDSIRHQRPLRASWEHGAYYLPRPAWDAKMPHVLAGSGITMMDAVRNAVRFGKIPVHDAVRMATAVPASALGLSRRFGRLAPGAAADLTVFTPRFDVTLTMVGGRVVHQKG